jgi:hypothetical protein
MGFVNEARRGVRAGEIAARRVSTWSAAGNAAIELRALRRSASQERVGLRTKRHQTARTAALQMITTARSKKMRERRVEILNKGEGLCESRGRDVQPIVLFRCRLD